MSRVGNKIIKIAQGTTVTLGANNHVEVKGPKGHIAYDFHPDMTIEVKDGHIKVSRPDDSLEHKTLHGTTRALLHNMVEGVSHEFSKSLEIQGTGFKIALKGRILVINAGFSHLVEMPIPEGITVVVPTPTDVTVSGVDKQAVGQFASEIYSVRKPEPYLGKGIRYKGQIVRRKEGKKAK